MGGTGGREARSDLNLTLERTFWHLGGELKAGARTDAEPTRRAHPAQVRADGDRTRSCKEVTRSGCVRLAGGGWGVSGRRRARFRPAGECGQRTVHPGEAKGGSSRKRTAGREQGAAWVLGARSLTTCRPPPTPEPPPGGARPAAAPRPAAPHLSSPAGSESPPETRVRHASSCEPPSCRPEAAGTAGSCSWELEAARFYDDGAEQPLPSPYLGCLLSSPARVTPGPNFHLLVVKSAHERGRDCQRGRGQFTGVNSTPHSTNDSECARHSREHWRYRGQRYKSQPSWRLHSNEGRKQ